jgi:MFS family permease
MICFSLGSIIGPSIGGYMVKQTGDLTSVIRISLAGFAILLLYLVAMPESLRKIANPQIPERDDNKDTRHVKKLSFLASIGNAVKRGFLAILEPLLFFAPGSIPVSPKAPSKYTLALIVIATHLVKLGLFGGYRMADCSVCQRTPS